MFYATVYCLADIPCTHTINSTLDPRANWFRFGQQRTLKRSLGGRIDTSRLLGDTQNSMNSGARQLCSHYPPVLLSPALRTIVPPQREGGIIRWIFNWVELYLYLARNQQQSNGRQKYPKEPIQSTMKFCSMLWPILPYIAVALRLLYIF